MSTDSTHPVAEPGALVGAPTSPDSITLSFTDDDDDNDYECSECLGTYSDDISMGNGAEWVQCGCGQWIHADCIDKTVIGSDGTERMCSNCVV